MSDPLTTGIRETKLGPRGCSCHDPTSPSPDPVVVRLEAEVERLNGDYAKLYGVVREYIACEKHPQIRGEAYRDLRGTYDVLTGADVDQGWPACYQRIQKQLDEAREELRQQTKSFCTHCGKLFPKGKEGVKQFREHIAECNAHPLHPMAAELADSEARNRTSLEVIAAREQHIESQRVEIERLRGLLREACDSWKKNRKATGTHMDDAEWCDLTVDWFKRVTAALDAKP